MKWAIWGTVHFNSSFHDRTADLQMKGDFLTFLFLWHFYTASLPVKKKNEIFITVWLSANFSKSIQINVKENFKSSNTEPNCK